MIGVSGGVEPIFALYYTRTTKTISENGDKVYKVYTKIAKDYMEANGLKDSDELPGYFITSSEIPYINRIKMQSAWQKHIDASISSTVNLPEETTVEQVMDLYEKAYDNGLKGITVFRNNCERAAILSAGSSKKKEEKKEEVKTEKVQEEKEPVERGMIEDVPDGLQYRKYKLKTGCGTLYLFVGYDEDEGKIYDIFTNTGAGGGCSINTQANSRLISACMRGGVPIEYIIEQLNKTDACPSFQFARGKGKELSAGKSCPSAIANVLKELLKEIKRNKQAKVTHYEIHFPLEFVKVESPKKEEIQAEVEESKKEIKTKNITCPECGQELRFESGCVTCPNCGWSKCE